MKIAVITDSGSGLDKQQAKALGLYFLPLQIIDQEDVYLDGFDTTCEDVFELIRNGKMMKTSLPPAGMVEALFKQLKEEGYEHAIFVPLTSGLSSTMQMVKMIAEQCDFPLSCVECYTTCYIQQYIALAALQLVQEGFALDTILERLEHSIEHSNTLIIPDDLDHLKRGGRLTPLAAALGGMLKIKPLLKLNQTSNGKIDTFAKVRTMSKAMKMAVDTFVEAGIKDDYILVVLHTDAPVVAEELRDLYFGKYPGNETIFGYIGPVIAVHTGIGCVGLQYVKKVSLSVA